MNIVWIIILTCIQIVHTAIIDNCIQYFINANTNNNNANANTNDRNANTYDFDTNSKTNTYDININSFVSRKIINNNVYNRKICLACRDGFYIKQGNCLQCNKFTRTIQCFRTKAYSYANNLLNLNNIDSTINRNTTTNNNNNNSNSNSNSNNNKQYKQMNNNINKIKDNQIMNQFINLQHCKQVNIKSICIKCFNGYQLNSNKVCSKIIIIINSQMKKCQVFSQVQNKCWICQQGYLVNIQGYCQQISIAKDSLIKNKQQQQTIQQKTKKKQQKLWYELGNKQKYNKRDDKIIQIISNQRINLNQIVRPTTLSFVLPQKQFGNVNHNKKTNNIQNENYRQVIIKQSQDNTQYFIKLNDQSCIQYTNITKLCTKCRQNYILNSLINSCIQIEKGITLITQKQSTNSSTQSKNNKFYLKQDRFIISRSQLNRNNQKKQIKQKINSIQIVNTIPYTNINANNNTKNNSNNKSNTTWSTNNIDNYNTNNNNNSTNNTNNNNTNNTTNTNVPKTNCQKIPNCEKYRQITNICPQCTLCRKLFFLNNGKCYNQFSYRLAQIAAKLNAPKT